MEQTPVTTTATSDRPAATEEQRRHADALAECAVAEVQLRRASLRWASLWPRFYDAILTAIVNDESSKGGE